MMFFSYASFFAVGFIILSFLSTKGNSISCYVCNSEFDPSCGDPFKPYTIGVLNCSLSIKPDHIAGQEAKLCRKIVQKIQGHVRVVRSCGYIEDPLRDDQECAKRSGTHDIQVDYCSCTGDLCNGTNKLHDNFLIRNYYLYIIIGYLLSTKYSFINYHHKFSSLTRL
ncbi:conserved hypothetical protein [Pediculus humanus corporis]|uniref:Uncharacterized protein n=1 Tax=Pediculus humanus subsp. corporis TaxID=121224 RepID=E0VZN0_PEDHC|nr:uncharacterized protein Phum_PHUM536780 [Pediculus humanus corporis]EEB18835.1 conserved hypothetical protein [Pediculus humanus corporis]